MVKSMTGFGRGAYEDGVFSCTVEMKTVNHRYNEVAIRLPRLLNPLEDRLRKLILSCLSRGRVDVYVTAASTGGAQGRLKVDRGLAAAYHQALEEIGQAIGCPEAPLNLAAELLHIARCPEVITVQEQAPDLEELWPKLQEAARQALEQLTAMRSAEGGHIAQDLLQRADLIAAKLALVEARAPQLVAEYQERLRERLTALLADSKVQVEPERLLQEAALFADRSNITEEIVRLQSHLKQFKATLGQEQPVGRKLDFLVQEFNREANTIGSKANDYQLAQLVVEIKAEIEKIREQIQNLE